MSQHDDDEDEDRRAILGRKAMFIASAMSGMALMDGCSRPPPQPCLSVAPYVPADAAAAPDATAVMTPEAGLPEPMPCLSVAMAEDASVEATPEVGLTQPMPCLSVAPRRDAGAPRDAGRPRREPRPRPCLSVLAEPMPCLSDSMEPPRRRSRPRFEAEPAPCLDVIPPGERYKAGDDDPSSEGQG